MAADLPQSRSTPQALVTGALPTGPTIGIIGAGQLARMTATAALKLGCHVRIFGNEPQSPAFSTATAFTVRDSSDPDQLLRFARECDVVTLENEFINWQLLERLENEGCNVIPSSRSIRLVQDKLLQKQTLAAAGLPLPAFFELRDPREILSAADNFGWPLVLKCRRDGYDGKGNFTLRDPSDLEAGFKVLNCPPAELYVEQFCHYSSELAVVATTALNGDIAVYPLATTSQKNHVCNEVTVPASVPRHIQERALQVATDALKAVGAIGTFAVELFLTQAGDILINELAPRVHNSGHYTIEACVSSQFENHVRAILNWPLGSPALVAPAAAMVNLLGTTVSNGIPTGMHRALSIAGAHVHLYSKSGCAPGRKMGHVTALGYTPAEALARARSAATEISFENVYEKEPTSHRHRHGKRFGLAHASTSS